MVTARWLTPRLRYSFALFLLACVLFVPAYKLANIQQGYKLQNDQIQHDSGCAYVADLPMRPPGSPFTRFVSDDVSQPEASRLVLFENDKAIGKPHALHDTIRKKGQGNYSHWGSSIIFSASDCSNPTTNGKEYEVKIPLTLASWVYAVWYLACITLILIGRQISTVDNTIRGFTEKLSRAFIPLQLDHRPLLGFGLFGLILLGAVIFLGSIWGTGKSLSLAIGGAYQISDASIYWICANSLLDLGSFGNQNLTGEWCQRRAIYPSFLSGLALFADRDIFGVLILQAIAVSIAWFAFLRRALSYIGFASVALCLILLYKFAAADAFTLTMTENAGLVFGCLGVALLFKAGEDKSALWAGCGIAALSMALNARAGAFFVLPFLVLWAGISAHLFKQKVWRWLFAAVVGASAGFALQAGLVLAVGGSPANSHGNFSWTLYGLSVGGKGWQQIQIDHPEVFTHSDAETSRQIYALAYQNIVANPEMLLDGVRHNAFKYFSSGTYGFDRFGGLSWLVTMLWWLSWIPVITNIRKHPYLLVALCSLGIMLSAPIIIGDGGPRVFAATVAIEIFQVALGFYWGTSLLLAKLRRQPFEQNEAIHKSAKMHLRGGGLELAATALFLVILVSPFTPLRNFVAQDRKATQACADNESTVITKIGRPSMLVNLVDESKSDKLHGEIERGKYISGLPSTAWYYDQAVAFKGKALLTAQQLDASDPYAPGPYMVISDINLSKDYYGKVVRLCIDKNKQETIFDVSYKQLNSINILE